eukprot:Lithocolla_globosa_v1_NODE_3314_length_1701_cov_2905.202793.p1 type:complete len:258 gc:universal NODE_3314_length_1701_cov_2905.202793:811-38(-)
MGFQKKAFFWTKKKNFPLIMPNKEECVYMSKTAEQAERYQDMIEWLKPLQPSDFGIEERNLLSVGYKNIVGGLRASLRVVASILTKEESKESKHVPAITAYKAKILAELGKTCTEALDYITTKLLPHAQDTGAKVFYHKMAGDYHRYMTEFQSEAEREKSADMGLGAYTSATTEAQQLATTDPIRLGLALNFSVFCYETMSDPEKACKMAKQAFDDAIADLDSLDENKYKDSTLIMQLLRDNLTLWTSEMDNNNPAE